MIAPVSAATNGCVYCTAHRGALLREETGHALFAEYLSRNYKLAPLSARHRAMLDFVVKISCEAKRIEHDDRDALRAVGFDDEQIWMIISARSFSVGANRIARATGLKPAAAYLDMYCTPEAATRKAG
jgi:uncharacterized peroxidase-related enzyme